MRAYAELSRRQGEISTTEAAMILDAHPVTLRRWAVEILGGGRARVTAVRRDLFGRYWFSEAEIRGLAEVMASEDPAAA